MNGRVTPKIIEFNLNKRHYFHDIDAENKNGSHQSLRYQNSFCDEPVLPTCRGLVNSDIFWMEFGVKFEVVEANQIVSGAL